MTSTPTTPTTPTAPAPGFPREKVTLPERVAWLALDDVAPSPENPRRRFDAEGLAGLADSIRTHGVLEPVLVRPVPPAAGADDAGSR